MKLSNRVLVAVGIAVATATLCGIGTVYWLATNNRIAELRDKMSSVIEQSEAVAESMDYMHRNRAIAGAQLLKDAKVAAGGRSLRETYSSSVLYRTIPIVASWQSVEKVATENGFEFLISTAPGLPARNPKNAIADRFGAAFETFQSGGTEYFLHDEANNELVLARPVRVRASCLACHGDPATSPDKSGNDALGFRMEGLKEGDIKGAFVLKAPLTSDAVIATTVWSMAGAGAVAMIGVLFGFMWFNRRFIVRPIRAAVGQLDAASSETRNAAGQISASSQTLAEASSQQVASLEQASVAIEQISAMTSNSADHATQAKQLAETTRQAADSGTTRMAEMQGAMDQIQNASNNIAKIIRSIDDIAFQTNILALNAAVEAARAGEAGAGFAVVADEVRSLAQRCALAAKETTEKIGDSITKTNLGTEICRRVGESLGQIATSAQQVDELVGQIANASQEQAQGVQKITSTISRLDQLARENAAGAEEGASASQELDAQTHTMKASVGSLEALVG